MNTRSMAPRLMIAVPTVLAFWLVLSVTLARAADMGYPRISLGGGVAGSRGVVEATASVFIFGPHLTFGGTPDREAYWEVAGSYLLVVGVGRTLGAPQGDRTHLFLGLPIPLLGVRMDGSGPWILPIGVSAHEKPFAPPVLIYAEPFLRRDWTTSDFTGGVLFKMSFCLDPKGWRP